MTKQKAPKFDLIKWLFVLALLVLGLVANYFYTSEPAPLKAAAWVILVIIMLLLMSRTFRGREIWRYLKDARMEVRRVVWPNRQETMQMTLVVFVMVIILALILWAVDSVFMSLLTWFTGT
ncbi:MAG: preprotein translocase subunit SecE [Gammaproteobacteria bacterium CG11_big_fil_rev_8_21_14_0_20_46_22]|nr:MAG: preprotein translocase subunit SecE [Gammaproteobacteria bacterium CG12_big_fil_rev_8_21_14_0_65_46_12]PIR11590.1 MAG: preprotein translocase subunit SecE [Gammaproteobacteria bacterium CG11_big_fil_rev_8_21_14_0_20_46_22]